VSLRRGPKDLHLSDYKVVYAVVAVELLVPKMEFVPECSRLFFSYVHGAVCEEGCELGIMRVRSQVTNEQSCGGVVSTVRTLSAFPGLGIMMAVRSIGAIFSD
jgi:hypothetical protein